MKSVQIQPEILAAYAIAHENTKYTCDVDGSAPDGKTRTRLPPLDTHRYVDSADDENRRNKMRESFGSHLITLPMFICGEVCKTEEDVLLFKAEFVTLAKDKKTRYLGQSASLEMHRTFVAPLICGCATARNTHAHNTPGNAMIVPCHATCATACRLNVRINPPQPVMKAFQSVMMHCVVGAYTGDRAVRSVLHHAACNKHHHVQVLLFNTIVGEVLGGSAFITGSSPWACLAIEFGLGCS